MPLLCVVLITVIGGYLGYTYELTAPFWLFFAGYALGVIHANVLRWETR